MASIRFAKVAHPSGVQLRIEGVPDFGALVNLVVENDSDSIVRIVYPLDVDELRELRDGIDKALAHCANNA